MMNYQATAANDNALKAPAYITRKAFIAGETYSCRSVCDYDCIFTWEIVRRTEKCIWISEDGDCQPKRVKIQKDSNGDEWAFPDGRYSMCPVIRA